VKKRTSTDPEEKKGVKDCKCNRDIKLAQWKFTSNLKKQQKWGRTTRLGNFARLY
jgi:hypothetical protein